MSRKPQQSSGAGRAPRGGVGRNARAEDDAVFNPEDVAEEIEDLDMNDRGAFVSVLCSIVVFWCLLLTSPIRHA